MRKSLFISIVVLFTTSLLAQVNSSEVNKFTGNLHYDSKSIAINESLNSNTSAMLNDAAKKNLLYAGGLSAILPGAGQFYNGEYWKAALFVAIEATAITFAVTNRSKGNDQTDLYRSYADGHWSVVKYAQWLMANKTALNIPAEINITISSNTSLPPWERVNWDELNKAEAVFSHKLEHYGEQQYYELIGKYKQYNHGWEDQTNDATAEYNANVTSMFLGYSGMRAKANDYYNISSGAVIAVVINHVLSVGEAIWSANSINKNLHLSMRIDPIQMGYTTEYIPTLNMNLRFASF